MKACNLLSSVFLIFLSMNSFARINTGVQSCYSKKDATCEVLIKKTKETDSSNYDVHLIDAINSDYVFPNLDSNSVMEGIYFYKKLNTYVFWKEYLDSTKANEFFTFHYESHQPVDLIYYYIESSIDFYGRTKKWSGQSCRSSSQYIAKNDEVSLLAAVSSLCSDKIKLLYDKNSYVGSDIFFMISKSLDGKSEGKSSVVALDSKDSSRISIMDIGCVTNCGESANRSEYIGKINNKFRATMYLAFNESNVDGYYYYAKEKKEIKISGKRKGNNVSLSTVDNNNRELFDGVMIDGQFKGVWQQPSHNKIFPFSFYLSLIQ